MSRERSTSELVEAVRKALHFRPLKYQQLGQDAHAALTELAECLEAAERDAVAVRQKMHHNATNLNVAIEQRQTAERERDELERAFNIEVRVCRERTKMLHAAERERDHWELVALQRLDREEKLLRIEEELLDRAEAAERELVDAEVDRRYQQDRARASKRKLAEERERFGRHVETMIEPKLLARAEAVERQRDEALEALREIVDWPIDESASAGLHFASVRQIARAALSTSEDA